MLMEVFILTDKIVMKLLWKNERDMVWRITKDGICYRSYNGGGYNYHNIRHKHELLKVIRGFYDFEGVTYTLYINTELLNKVR